MAVSARAFQNEKTQGPEGGSSVQRERREGRVGQETEQPKTLDEVIAQIKLLAPEVVNVQGRHVAAHVEAISRLLDGIRVEKFPDHIRGEVTQAIDGWHALDKTSKNLQALLDTLDRAHGATAAEPHIASEPSEAVGQEIGVVEESATVKVRAEKPSVEKTLEKEFDLVTTDKRELELRREHRELVAKQAVMARQLVNEARAVESLREAAKAAEHLQGNELVQYVQQHITSQAIIEARGGAVNALTEKAPGINWGVKASHYNPLQFEGTLLARTFYGVGKIVEGAPMHVVGDVFEIATTGVKAALVGAVKGGWQAPGKIKRALRQRTEFKGLQKKAAMEAARGEGKTVIVDRSGPYQVAKLDAMLEALREMGSLENTKESVVSSIRNFGGKEPQPDTRPGMRSIIRQESLRRTEKEFANNLAADKIKEIENDADYDAMFTWLQQNGRHLTLDSFEKVGAAGQSGVEQAEGQTEEGETTEEAYEIKTGLQGADGNDLVIRLTKAEMQELQGQMKGARTEAAQKEMRGDLLRSAIQKQVAESGNPQLAKWFQKNAGKLESLVQPVSEAGATENAYQLRTGITGKGGTEIVLKLEGEKVKRAQDMAKVAVDHADSLRKAARFFLRQHGEKSDLARAADFDEFNVELEHDGTMLIDVLTNEGSRLITVPEKYSAGILEALKEHPKGAEPLGTEALQGIWRQSGERISRGRPRVPEAGVREESPAANVETAEADTGSGSIEGEQAEAPAVPAVAEVAAAGRANEAAEKILTIEDVSTRIIEHISRLTAYLENNNEIQDAQKLIHDIGKNNVLARFDTSGQLVIGKKSAGGIDEKVRITLSKAITDSQINSPVFTNDRVAIWRALEKNKITATAEKEEEPAIVEIPTQAGAPNAGAT